jgi:ABC-type uncharacterized transport system permease subunit
MTENVPSTAELIMLLASAVLLAASVAASASRPSRAVAMACGWIGVLVGALVLLNHSIGRGAWMPLEDNFDALGALGLMLAGCVLYVQSTRPVGGLDWFVLPVAALLLVGAAVFGKTAPRQYGETAWSITHRLTAYGGTLALVVAGAVGGMYLVANRRLRSKQLAGAAVLGNLERLEEIAHVSLVLGWPLFTVGLITGLLWGIHLTAHGADQQREFFGPKVLLALGAWVLYALALHTPMNPSFRGRKAAVLSLIGLVLMAGTLVAVQFMPGGGRH